MREYSEKFGINLEKVKQDLYKKYGIKSRRELKREQVLFEIESYKAGLME